MNAVTPRPPSYLQDVEQVSLPAVLAVSCTDQLVVQRHHLKLMSRAEHRNAALVLLALFHHTLPARLNSSVPPPLGFQVS